MTVLQDHQFELDGQVFGIFTDVSVEQNGFKPSGRSWRTQDKANEREGGVGFGIDHPDGQVWAFEMFTDARDTETALAALARLEKAWRGDTVRLTPGAVMPLRYALAGRTRRVYGRPRRWSAPPTNMILGGMVPITADFQCADDLFYEDEEQSIEVQLIAPSAGGGLLSPLISPLISQAGSAPRGGEIVVGGDTPTWAVVEFEGACTRPWLEVAGWRVELDTSLAYDDTVVIDPYPWARTVIRNESSSLGGKLTRASRLARMQLPPGRHAVTFGSADSASTAVARVRWRGANTSL